MPLPRPTRPLTREERELSDQTLAPMSQTLATKAPTQHKPSDTFLFHPQPDITAHELAQLIQVFFNGIMLHHEPFAKLPDPLKRHFEHRKIS